MNIQTLTRPLGARKIACWGGLPKSFGFALQLFLPLYFLVLTGTTVRATEYTFNGTAKLTNGFHQADLVVEQQQGFRGVITNIPTILPVTNSAFAVLRTVG